MATLYITEFRGLDYSASPRTWGAGPALVQAAPQPPIAEQTVAIGGASVASNAFAATTLLVRLHADASCSIEFGAAPTASATTARMAAGQTEYFGVSPGMKVAVIANT